MVSAQLSPQIPTNSVGITNNFCLNMSPLALL